MLLYLLLLSIFNVTNGTSSLSHQKISMTSGTFTGWFMSGDRFGNSAVCMCTCLNVFNNLCFFFLF